MSYGRKLTVCRALERGVARACRLESALALLVLSLALESCSGVPDASTAEVGRSRHRIVGGQGVASGAFPGVVWLDVGCTGVLIAEDTVLYAAHCGLEVTQVWLGDAVELEVDAQAQTVRVLEGERSVAVEYCEAHPEPVLGGSTDLAFCRLAEPAVERQLLPFALAGCEREALAIGTPVTLVGAGLDPASGQHGVKQVTQAPLSWNRAVLIAGDGAQGTCTGDSGGPLFVRTDDLAPEWAAEWRLAGILSAGESQELCGSGRYADVRPGLAWIETATRRELSPCENAEGTWAPTPRCARPALDEQGTPIDSPSPSSETCGPSAERALADDGPPAISTIAVLPHMSASDEIEIRVEATDAGVGIESVMLEVLGGEDEVLWSERSETVPYIFGPLALPADGVRLRAVARDFGGLVAVSEQSLSSPASGCALHGGAHTGSGRGFLLIAAVCVARRVRRTKSTRCRHRAQPRAWVSRIGQYGGVQR
jgi:hypothetical protein